MHAIISVQETFTSCEGGILRLTFVYVNAFSNARSHRSHAGWLDESRKWSSISSIWQNSLQVEQNIFPSVDGGWMYCEFQAY